jgi:serine/threonine protein kinase
MLGRTIHNYQIVDRLGSGSMGAVYRARDTSLELDVAVKNLPEDVAADPQAFARFKRQVRAAMSLNHPNICAINTVLTENGQWFIIMELLEGQTLQGLLARATREVGATDTWTRPPLDVLTFFRLAIQIAEALIAADTKQLIHGGIKPANIIVTRRGDAKIMDYGLANLPGAAASRCPRAQSHI